MLKAYKYRLYPTKSQEERINQHIGTCRFLYNLALETKEYAYRIHRVNLTAYDLMKQLTDLKNECDWLKDIDRSSMDYTLQCLETAYKNFFRGSAFPKFKRKNSLSQTFTYKDKYCQVKEGKLYQGKFRDGIKIKLSQEIGGKIKRSTISKTSTGKYFVSILVETGKDIPKLKPINEKSTLGIDLGLKSFIVTSEGESVDNPKLSQKIISHLKFLQSQARKKKNGSKNRKKANLKISLQYERIANKRKDFLHKLSTNLVKSHDTICCENLNITGMLKNHSLAGSISGASWGEFIGQLKYKGKWYGKNILQIPTFEPSTKICSNCGATNHALTLADREWFCAPCGSFHDRDTNAAINIKNYCLENYGGELHRQKSVELPAVIWSYETER